MLFLFVEHAFDVGDLLEVEGMQYRVKKIDLMYTLMVKSTGEHSYYPNTRLITLPVLNLTRATGRTDKVVFSLDVGRGGAAARAALMVSLWAVPCAWTRCAVPLCCAVLSAVAASIPHHPQSHQACKEQFNTHC
jgi:hypothetical protein